MNDHLETPFTFFDQENGGGKIKEFQNSQHRPHRIGAIEETIEGCSGEKCRLTF